jgi:hypothetical protein
LDEPDGVDSPPTRQGSKGVRQLWLQCASWAALALAAGLGAHALDGGWRVLLVVLTVLLAVLATWVGAFALLGSPLAAIVSRATDAPRSLWTLVPWWIWGPSSVVSV